MQSIEFTDCELHMIFALTSLSLGQPNTEIEKQIKKPILAKIDHYFYLRSIEDNQNDDTDNLDY
jgi:hypothetical protein